MSGSDQQIRMGASFHILTGAPGTGKTALLESLTSGVRWVPEPAREILAQQRSIDGDGTWDRNPSRFVELLLQQSIENYETAQRLEGPVIFDRGVPDCITYAEWGGIDPTPSIEAAATYRYQPEVLVTRPWEEIYRTDDERKMPFAAVVEFLRLLESAYERTGYSLVEVPRGSADDRAASVQASIAGT
ncbi:MAG: AAA family ATPase [Acidimicrobiia bacterium]